MKVWFDRTSLTQSFIDPKVGKALGFGDVILHGLSSYGFAARAIIRTVAGGDKRALKMMTAKFTSPVTPGDELETQAWQIGSGPNGAIEIVFITKDVTTGKVRGFRLASMTHSVMLVSGCIG